MAKWKYWEYKVTKIDGNNCCCKGCKGCHGQSSISDKCNCCMRTRFKNKGDQLQIINQISVAPVKFPGGQGFQGEGNETSVGKDVVLAGSRNLGKVGGADASSQVSVDGTGAAPIADGGNETHRYARGGAPDMNNVKVNGDARFTFLYANVEEGAARRKGKMKIKFDRFAGVSLSMLHDARTGKRFLIVAEGSAHKIRMVDVTDNMMIHAKVTTVGIIAGPMQVSPGVGSDDVMVFSTDGQIQQLDLYPTLKCDPLLTFMLPFLNACNASSFRTTNVYHLLRAGASDSGVPKPWEITIQKKTEESSSEKVLLTKYVICSKQLDSKTNKTMQVQSGCCVRKAALRTDSAGSPTGHALLNMANDLSQL